MSVKKAKYFSLKIFLFGILMFAALKGSSQSIAVTNISPGIICAGSDVVVTFSTTSGNGGSRRFSTASVYTIFLRNSTGTIFTSVTFTKTSIVYTGGNGGVTNNITQTFTIPASISTGSYTISVGSTNPTFNGSGGAGASTPFTVNALPAAPVAGNNGPVCAGSTLSLTASTVAGATYSWTGPNSFSSILQNPTIPGVTSAAAGIYNVTATIAGCEGPAGSTTVSITPSPLVTIVASSNPVCEGTPITLTSTSSGGVLATISGSNATGQAISATGTPTIVSTITMPNGLLSSASDLRVNLNINHTWVGDLKVSLTGPGTIGTTILFDRPGNPSSVDGNGDNLVNTGNYSFSIAGTTVIPELAAGGGSIPVGTYKPSDATGLAHNFTGIVPGTNVAGVWTLSIIDNAAIDGGNLNNWSITVTNAAGTYTTIFNGPGTISPVTYSGVNNSIATATVISPVGLSNLYSATTAISGCSTTSLPVTVTVNAKPLLSTSLNPPAICNNSVFSYNPASVTASTIFNWTRALQVGISNAAASGTGNPNETLVNTGGSAVNVIYVYTLTANGCSNTPQNVTITVYPALNPGSIGSNQTICLNSAPSTLTNSSSPTGGNGVYSYQWQSSPDNVTFSNIAGAVANSYAPGILSSITYYRRIASSGFCSVVVSNVVSILINNGGTWTGASNSDYFNSANWQCGIIPALTTNVIIPTGLVNYPVIISAIGLANNLTIQTAASVTVSGGSLKIAGTISNSGIFNAANGSIELSGSSPMITPAGMFAGNLIKNLTCSNSTGITLGGVLNLSGILKITSGNFTTGGFLTLLADATQTAMIDGSGTGTVSGNVTMQGHLPSGFGYKYISSPFQAATVNELAAEVNLVAPFPTVYANDQSLLTAGWVKYINPGGILNPMEGYAVNFGTSSAAKTIDMTGAVNNSTVSRTLFNHNQTYTLGFNLVGNPYPSPINWNTGAGWIKVNIDNSLYFFNASTTDQYGGTYSSYVNGISSDGGISSNIIPAMQGFFVHVSNGTFPVPGSLTINNSARTNLFPSAKILKGKGDLLSSSSANFRQSDATDTRIMLRMQATYEQGALVSDPAVIYFDDMASKKFDKEYDALKLMNTDKAVANLYTISSDALNLSINALPASTDSVSTIPVGIKTEQSGFVNFSVSNLNSIPYSLKVYFQDAQTKQLHDLRLDPNYRVQLNAGKFDNRFSLLFSLKDIDIQTYFQNSLNAFYASGKLVYQLKGIQPNSKGSVLVINIGGQILNRSNFTGTDKHEIQLALIPGIYIISTSTENGRLSKKIVVN